jgi:hypothetical protein
MTADTSSDHPPRRARRAAASLLTLTLLAAGAAACAQEADDGAIQMEEVDANPQDGGDSTSAAPANFEATTDFLKESATRSESASRRVEMRFAVGETVPDDAPPLMQGEVDGDQFHYTMDLGPIMEGVMSEFGGSGADIGNLLGDTDLTMEMIGTGDTWYLRAPMFSDAGGLLAGSTPGYDDLAVIGDGWGSIDAAQFDDVVPGDLQGALVGSGGADPSAIIEMITNAEGVEDLGTSTIRDVPVHGLRAEVTLAEMMEASGQSPDLLAEAGGAGDTEAFMQELINTSVPVEVWIDDDGYLARMSYGFSMAEIFEAMGMSDTLDQVGIGDLAFAYSIDMFDYGETFTFEAPPDAVDITDAVAESYQA